MYYNIMGDGTLTPPLPFLYYAPSYVPPLAKPNSHQGSGLCTSVPHLSACPYLFLPLTPVRLGHTTSLEEQPFLLMRVRLHDSSLFTSPGKAGPITHVHSSLTVADGERTDLWCPPSRQRPNTTVYLGTAPHRGPWLPSDQLRGLQVQVGGSKEGGWGTWRWPRCCLHSKLGVFAGLRSREKRQQWLPQPLG